MPDETGILSPQSTQELFRELLTAAMQNQGARVGEETEFYLVQLLARFVASEQLFVRDENGSARTHTLSFLLKEALEEQGPARLQLLKKLGDTSLFVSGFIPESLNRSLVGVDYYISMGERAYDAITGEVERQARGGWGKPPAPTGVFAELADKFGAVVDLLNEVSERTWACTNAGLVRLYDKYVLTGSSRLSGLLREQGLPQPAIALPRGKLPS